MPPPLDLNRVTKASVPLMVVSKPMPGGKLAELV